MANLIQNTKNAIKSILINNVTGLKGVYTYYKGDPGQYPIAVIIKKNESGQIADNTRNRHTLYFDISVYQEMSDELFGPEKAERITDELADSIRTAFDTNMQLGIPESVRKALIIEASYDATDSRELLVRLMNFTLEVECLTSASN